MEKGFTIIELIISIFILAIAIVGVSNAFYIITSLTTNSSDRLAATYLAQEGMEIVRNIRDQNWLNMDTQVAGATWLSNGLNLAACSPSSSGCQTDYHSSSIIAYNGDYLCPDSNGFYSQPSGSCSSSTKFKRKITITCLDKTGTVDNNCLAADYIIKVKSEVAWDQKATILNSGDSSADTALLDNCASPADQNNCIVVEETLYDWYNFPSSDKSISIFEFDSLDPKVYGVIDQTNHIINLNFTSAGNLNLIPTIQFVGASISPAIDAEEDFSKPQTYTVTAADGSTQAYTINVIVPMD